MVAQKKVHLNIQKYIVFKYTYNKFFSKNLRALSVSIRHDFGYIKLPPSKYNDFLYV